MRVMHLLHRSVPGTHGYAIRSREIVMKQRDKGLEPLVITSPSQAPLGTLDSEGCEYIDGIRYFRTCSNVLPPTTEVSDKSPIKASLRVFQNLSLFTTAMRVARDYRPSVIHGHSPFTCGLVADAVGRVRGIPIVYEMRGIWEDSHAARDKITENSIRYRVVRGLENMALRGADRCCMICEALKQEILSRHVIGEEKTFVVPNGVDVKRFVPGPANERLLEKLGLKGRTVMGYLGTFFHYEGLDLLVEAMSRLAPAFPELSLLLVGHGELMPTLEELVDQRHIRDRVIFTGKVPHEEVTDYYRLFDLMVLPRRDTRETRLVTPLKPMEIMAMERPLIASDIGGHCENIENVVNGTLFKSEDVDDLVDKCRQLISSPDLRSELGTRARRWVEMHRDWNVLIERYVNVYEGLAAAHRHGNPL
ncbi:MAG: glycosyltransferase [Desulfomonile tiedjei]|nr:glycosyltransferase [Desulfomonile tiedjei]